MNILRALSAAGMVALLVSASGCACCPWKSKACCDTVGCCDSIGGRSMACKYFEGCCKSYLPVCNCTGPKCCDTQCGCGCEPDCCAEPACCAEPDCCCEPECCAEPACCAEPDCCCEPDCCAEPACGCDDCCDACGCGDGCKLHLLGRIKQRLGGIMGKCLGGCCGCGGCDGEIYWNEWHNDPPRCCDPCDKCGNWIGPSTAYRAPYDHPYCK